MSAEYLTDTQYVNKLIEAQAKVCSGCPAANHFNTVLPCAKGVTPEGIIDMADDTGTCTFNPEALKLRPFRRSQPANYLYLG